jgi:DNA-binding MarR family transcriptional regulator
MGQMTPYLIFALLVLLVILLMVLTFFPRLEKVEATENVKQVVERQSAERQMEGDAALYEEIDRDQPIEIAIRLLEPDERRVVKALRDSGGTMLQKDISHELGFSRVKTHRVLVKLIRRGIITTEKYYNTNKIELVDWLKPDE